LPVVGSESDLTRTNQSGADLRPADHGPFPARDSGRHGRFLPGTIIADRYRIVALLGRGGMGEVYRADDLKLDQPVALKFLPRNLARDGARLARFHNEVRVARQISHPNVCRVHDIGEVSGEHFLSMEYVDGEDLASLLRRIGRMPVDKGIEIARQLCAGLAVAHGNSVLHRDLKPANVMIDGRGRVKIADFGLAVVSDRLGANELAGTPAYMAPEQVRGAPASVKTDIYALGLVLYEMFTGNRAFKEATFASRASESRNSTPPMPAAVLPEIDPAVERVVVRCMDWDPARRPASALAVAAALPGGDPLAAALAAGETPSPEMVAAAGGVGSLRLAVAWGCFAVIVAGLVSLTIAGDRVSAYRLLAGSKSPELLTERARSVLASFGYGSQPLDTAVGFDLRDEYLLHLEKQGQVGVKERLAFWYRESPQYLVPWRLRWWASLDDPPATLVGMKTVVLDPQGRLLEFRAVPQQIDTSQENSREMDWSAMFAAAELLPQSLTAARSTWNPPVYADAKAAWEGVFPAQPDIPIRVESAAYRGRVVYFAVMDPWTRSTSSVQSGSVTNAIATTRSASVATSVVLMVLMAAAALVARRNVRLGRGDQKGASRLALYVLLLGALSFVMGASHVSGTVEEFGLFLGALSSHLLYAAVFWLLYLALEPHVRRQWPERMIAWTRLLSGRIRDPLIGRDILVGGAFAVGSYGLVVLAPAGLPASAAAIVFDDRSLLAVRTCVGLLSRVQITAIGQGLTLMFLLVLLTFVLRKRSLAIAGLWLTLALVNGLSVTNWHDPAYVLAWLSGPTIATLVLVRFGVLALISAGTFLSLMQWYPVTADLSAWYSFATMFAMSACLALAGAGLYTTLGGKPFAGWKVIEEP
jgi:serine/threonine-protein kinase